MKKIWVILAVFALVLTAGCAEKSKTSSAKSESGASERRTARSASAAPSSSASTAQSSQKTGITLKALLTDIQTAAPGSAGSSLKQMRAAGELLDWAQAGNTADADEVREQLEKSDFPAASTAYAWAGVLDAADEILDGTAGDVLRDAGYTLRSKTYAPARFRAAAKSLSLLFTRAMAGVKSTSYTLEPHGVYQNITLEKFQGIWCNGADETMLVISGSTCREVAPYLDACGETAVAVRVQDRSEFGYCPVLEIDSSGKGDYSGALTYYVSGVDATHFWCNTQSERFDLLRQEG